MTDFLYRAGTDESPLFQVLNNKVWLITDPRLYYPPDQDQPRRSTRATPVACLWVTSRSSIPDTLITEKHPNLKEIVLVKLKETPKKKDCEGKLKKLLGSITWTQTSVPPSYPRGMTRMNVSVLVHAVLEYLKDHRPTTPQESNFQAELKAASHWYWFKENERMQFVSRHFDDVQLKKIAKLALERWTKKLNEIKRQAKKWLSAKQGDSDDSNSCGSIEDEISDLEENIFSLRMYYGRALEETDDDNLPSTGTPTLQEDDRSPKMTKVSLLSASELQTRVVHWSTEACPHIPPIKSPRNKRKPLAKEDTSHAATSKSVKLTNGSIYQQFKKSHYDKNLI